MNGANGHMVSMETDTETVFDDEEHYEVIHGFAAKDTPVAKVYINKLLME